MIPKPYIDEQNRSMGRWFGEQVYIIGGRTYHVVALRLELGFYSCGLFKFDNLNRVVEVYADMTRDRAEAIMKVMGQLIYLEEAEAEERRRRDEISSAAYEAYYASQFPHLRGGAYVRPPEPVYEPGGTDVRLTPSPRDLLIALRDGERLHERSWRWTTFELHVEGEPPKKPRGLAVTVLREHCFIARDGVLPEGRLTHFHEFDWSITDAGKAWLEANAKPAAPAAQPQETT